MWKLLLFQLEHIFVRQTKLDYQMLCVLGLQGLSLDMYRLIFLVDSLFVVVSPSK